MFERRFSNREPNCKNSQSELSPPSLGAMLVESLPEIALTFINGLSCSLLSLSITKPM
jgi:hypothetical protein